MNNVATIAPPTVALTGPLPAGTDYAVSINLLSTFEAIVGELGGNPAQLLRQAGVAPAHLIDPGGFIPLRALGTLLQSSAEALDCPDLGLRLAERQCIETMMKPLDRMFRFAPTLRDALEYGARHVCAFNSAAVMELAEHSGKGLHLVDFKLLDTFAFYPQLMEQMLLLLHKSILWLSGGFARSRTVWLSHSAMAPPACYARRFGTVVRFDKEFDGIFLSADDLARPVVECNSEAFASEARIVAERFPSRHDIVTRVRQTIHRALAESDDFTRQHVASLLGIQERTLNRQLSKRGTSFEAIRDEVRRSLAYRYLARADLPIAEISGRLGYSEPAVLTRCCRRWFGTSPRQMRRVLLTLRGARPGGCTDLSAD